MYKYLYSNNTSEKSKQDKNKLRITKQSLNDIDDYILNFQRYYELIKNNPNLRPNNGSKNLDLNTINIDNINKKIPYNKLQNDLSTIYKRVYSENNTEKNNQNIIKYHSLIRPNKYYINTNKINNKKIRNKIFKNEFNSQEKYFDDQIEIDNDLEINTFKKNNVKGNKFEYGNYAMNNTNFNHPQLYLLKYNKSYDKKNNRLPQINTQNSLKITRTGDLSNLIPQNTKKAKFRNNFYNYYIGMKHFKQNFNL